MDILEQYNKSSPPTVRRIMPDTDTNSYGLLTHMIMRMSGGRIRDDHMARSVLLGIAILFSLAALAVFFAGFNVLPQSRFSEEDARRQMEEYQQIQPF